MQYIGSCYLLLICSMLSFFVFCLYIKFEHCFEHRMFLLRCSCIQPSFLLKMYRKQGGKITWLMLRTARSWLKACVNWINLLPLYWLFFPAFCCFSICFFSPSFLPSLFPFWLKNATSEGYNCKLCRNTGVNKGRYSQRNAAPGQRTY